MRITVGRLFYFNSHAESMEGKSQEGGQRSSNSKRNRPHCQVIAPVECTRKHLMESVQKSAANVLQAQRTPPPPASEGEC